MVVGSRRNADPGIHDAGDTDLNQGAIRWVEGGFSPEWRFQGGRSGGEGTWDGKQDPNVVDILPLPGAGHAYPDSLTGEMMDYTRPQNRIRIETDEYPVRLSASRFEDREAPEMDFSRYFAFSAGTVTPPSAPQFEVTAQPSFTPAKVNLLEEGWIDLTKGDLGLAVGVKWFWQMFPKSLAAEPNGLLRVGLYPEGSKPLEVYRGDSRTHYLTLFFHDGKESQAAK
jgi:hypothetical protein